MLALLLLGLLFCFAVALGKSATDANTGTIAVSSDSASGLVVGLFLLFMIAFGIKMMLGIEISDSVDENTESK